ncbi:MAG: molybdenum cofactor guanylyltransferase [Planctomycetota bacterium]
MVTPGPVTSASANDRGIPRPEHDDVLGLVLCGGRSVRMGRDKGALELGDRTLVERAASVLDDVADLVVLATGDAPRYAASGRGAVLDGRYSGAGPVAGLAAGLAEARARGRRWLAVLACDMPAVTAEPLRALLARARAQNLDACLFEHAGTPEPMLAVYHVRALGPVRRAIAAGRVRMIDFHRGFGELRVDRTALGCEKEDPDSRGRARAWTSNVNTPADWRRAVSNSGPQRSDSEDA